MFGNDYRIYHCILAIREILSHESYNNYGKLRKAIHTLVG
jgi:hypothetical protein